MKPEICDGCSEPKPNVGPWSDGRRLCGGCKLRITLARPGMVRGLERELSAALGQRVTIDVTDADGLPVVPKGDA
jgi:hypothetical protein